MGLRKNDHQEIGAVKECSIGSTNDAVGNWREK